MQDHLHRQQVAPLVLLEHLKIKGIQNDFFSEFTILQSIMLFSSHLVTWFLIVFGEDVTKHLVNGKNCTENHATKVTKKQKLKLPKYAMSQALDGLQRQCLCDCKFAHVILNLCVI